MSKMGKRLLAAAKEARAIARGEADPKTYRVHVPAKIDVQKIRKKLRLSQTEFASRFGIAPGTLWIGNRSESGRKDRRGCC